MMQQWDETDKLDYLMRLPWTILPQEGDEADEIVLTCAELPSVIGAGATQREVTEEFWTSLRMTLRSFITEGDPTPLPRRFAGRLPWESDEAERLAARIRAVMTTSGETLATSEAPRLTSGIEGTQSESLDGDLAAA
jgi:hypothetical protein